MIQGGPNVTGAVDCPYFYGDYQRGRNLEKCRLIERNRTSARRWKRTLCRTCPVPKILRETACRHLALEASVGLRWGLLERVTVYAICTEGLHELPDPRRCPTCEGTAQS